jgi:hypothetical protein
VITNWRGVFLFKKKSSPDRGEFLRGTSSAIDALVALLEVGR